jgi:hypothetical protein
MSIDDATLFFLVTKKTKHFPARYFFGILSEKENVSRFLTPGFFQISPSSGLPIIL